jgi:cytochrome c551/c552
VEEGELVKWLQRIVLILLVLLAVSQFIRPSRTNPPIDPAHTLHATGQAPPPIEAILDRSCRDCHSSKTVWPWYTNVAPISWWLSDHVHSGRKEVSFSEWATYPPKKQARKLKEICDQVREGDMPLKTYLPMHPEAKLSDADRQAICDWSKQQMARLGVQAK